MPRATKVCLLNAVDCNCCHLTPSRYRFPHFERLCWYAAQYYCQCLRVGGGVSISNVELFGVECLCDFLFKRVLVIEASGGSKNTTTTPPVIFSSSENSLPVDSQFIADALPTEFSKNMFYKLLIVELSQLVLIATLTRKLPPRSLRPLPSENRFISPAAITTQINHEKAASKKLSAKKRVKLEGEGELSSASQPLPSAIPPTTDDSMIPQVLDLTAQC